MTSPSPKGTKFIDTRGPRTLPNQQKEAGLLIPPVLPPILEPGTDNLGVAPE